MRWVVDASNVIGSRPDGWWRDRPAALDRLLDEVARWQQEAGDEVTVVVDGHPTPSLPDGRSWAVEVRWAHSRARDAADDVIAELVRTDPEPAAITVVTSDRELRDRATAAGARVEGARRFRERITDIAARRSDRAVLAAFGTDERALIGHGGEARVFAIDDERVVRLPHPWYPTAALEERRRFLDAIRDAPFPVATPVVLDHVVIEGRTVVVERRLPGTDALRMLADPATDRVALVRHHLDVAHAVVELPCPTERFGEVWGDRALVTDTFGDWSRARLRASLAAGGPAFAHVDPDRITDELLEALPAGEPAAPSLVHLDVFLGNLLAVDRRVSALLDFGPMTIGGPPDLDPLVAIAYLEPEITPTADASDLAAARAWAADHDLVAAVDPAARFIAAYWAGAPDDARLRTWCLRLLAD